MSAGALISVEEYLNTSYDPDVEYVDGALVGGASLEARSFADIVKNSI